MIVRRATPQTKQEFNANDLPNKIASQWLCRTGSDRLGASPRKDERSATPPAVAWPRSPPRRTLTRALPSSARWSALRPPVLHARHDRHPAVAALAAAQGTRDRRRTSWSSAWSSVAATAARRRRAWRATTGTGRSRASRRGTRRTEFPTGRRQGGAWRRGHKRRAAPRQEAGGCVSPPASRSEANRSRLIPARTNARGRRQSCPRRPKGTAVFDRLHHRPGSPPQRLQR